MKVFHYCKKYLVLCFLFISCVGLNFLFIGCQGADFYSLASFDCSEEGNVEGLSCGESIIDEGVEIENYRDTQLGPVNTIRSRLGRINILFVVDNSGSMEEELASIANQFDIFLDTIKKTDYRIAITTTDWVNNRGQFLEFPNNRYFLDNPEGNTSVHNENVQYFQKTIQRPVGHTNDERGIYVLNQILDNSENDDFFRPHSLLVVIIVSDEDERSTGGRGDNPAVLEEEDLPETFFRKVSREHKYSIVTVHSIIIPPGDLACAKQANGVDGTIYAQASDPSSAILAQYGNIQKGHVGSICSSNYSSQLGPIADTLVNVPPFPLPCFPSEDHISVEIDRKKMKVRADRRKLFIEDKAFFGAKIKVSFRCLKNRRRNR